MGKIKKVVLAYSGGLDTSVIIPWIKENYGAEVIAYAADIGQGEELKPLKAKAKKSGASETYIVDLKEEFVKDFVFPMLRANAIYEGQYYLGTSIARPLIAKAQMEIAKKVGADAISHGATGKGNDQVRFELTAYAINPKIKVIAPWREWEFEGREDLIDYAKKKKIPVPVTKAKPYSMDANMLHISYEGGVLEDAWAEPPESMFKMTKSPEKAPNKPTYIEITYKEGDPQKLNGKRLSPANMLSKLNDIGGKNAIGRADCVESRYLGMKSRGVYETPGGTILHVAHRAMESMTMDREEMKVRDSLIPEYSSAVYNGYWYAPEREAMQALIDKTQENVTGTVRLKLYKGNVTVVGRKSSKSLYRSDLASFEGNVDYDQKDAEGFIKINSLRLKTRSKVRKFK